MDDGLDHQRSQGSGIAPTGRNLDVAIVGRTDESDIPYVSSPGTHGAGLIQHGWLEVESGTPQQMIEVAVVLFMVFTVVSLLLIPLELRSQGRQLNELTERPAAFCPDNS